MEVSIKNVTAYSLLSYISIDLILLVSSYSFEMLCCVVSVLMWCTMLTLLMSLSLLGLGESLEFHFSAKTNIVHA